METEAADRRQFQSRPDRVDPEAEPEQVQLDPLVSRDEDAGKAKERHLKPRSAWRDGEASSSNGITFRHGNCRSTT